MNLLRELTRYTTRGALQEESLTFSASDVSHEPDDVTMVLVMSNHPDDSYYDDYHGVNVVFDKLGKVTDLVTADPKAEDEAKKFRSKIISAARKELQDDKPKDTANEPD